jgi:GNAT superfamily N-acetyltransferase
MSTAADRGGGLSDPIEVRPVASRRDLDDFIGLPSRLYSHGHPGFVQPLRFERREALTPGRNPFFEHAEAQLFVARRRGEVVGRVSAQIDRLYLDRYKDATGHFGFIDAVDDAAVFHDLLAAAERWLVGKGMNRAVGPFNFSTNEEVGLLIDGFDAPPVMMMPYSPPYAGAHLEAAGYAKIKDLIAYDYDVEANPTFTHEAILRRAGLDPSLLSVRNADMKQFQRDLRIILDIFNDAWADNWGYVPLTEAEIAHAAKSMKPVVDPNLVVIASVNGEPAAMIVCLPNIYEAIAGLDGRLLPFGWLKLLWRLKVSKIRTGRVLLFGVRKEFQRSVLGSAVILRVLEELRKGGQRINASRCELSWILEDNVPMRKIIEKLGGRAYKTYRVYEKPLRPEAGAAALRTSPASARG